MVSADVKRRHLIPPNFMSQSESKNSVPQWRACAVARQPHVRPRSAFTLVEMLAVMGVILILMALVVPAVVPLMRSIRISQAGDMIHTQVELARQTALAENRTVEVRFCRPSSTTQFNAIMPLVCTGTNPSGNYIYSSIGKPSTLPTGMIIDAGSTLSTILNPVGVSPSPAQNTDPQLGSLGTSYQYVAFHFKPDGSTDLIGETSTSLNSSSTSLWFLTVHNSTDGDSLTAAPRNFYSIQIDAYDGHLVDYRP